MSEQTTDTEARRKAAKEDYEAWRVRVLDNPTTEADILAALKEGTLAAAGSTEKMNQQQTLFGGHAGKDTR
jgi:hypothetical protein